jgi:hypothetical protein
MRAQQWEEIAPDVSETLELPGVLKEMQAPPVLPGAVFHGLHLGMIVIHLWLI